MASDLEAYGPFAVIREDTGFGACVLHVFGEIDIATAEAFESELLTASREHSALVIDFTRCQYLDSTALTIAMRFRKRYNGQLRIRVGDNRRVLRILQVTGLDHFLNLEA